MTKKRIIILSIILIIVGFFVFVLLFGGAELGKTYITTDIENYGEYIGNYDNKTVAKQINSFFPESIEDSFSSVRYSYRAQIGDTYAYEAFLEFIIEDKEQFLQFVSDHTAGIDGQVFEYDNEFVEHSISQKYILTDDVSKDDSSVKDNSHIGISRALIQKILVNENEQRIIFVCLGVWDGGYVRMDYLSTFFDRFGIDPKEYAAPIY